MRRLFISVGFLAGLVGVVGCGAIEEARRYATASSNGGCFLSSEPQVSAPLTAEQRARAVAVIRSINAVVVGSSHHVGDFNPNLGVPFDDGRKVGQRIFDGVKTSPSTCQVKKENHQDYVLPSLYNVSGSGCGMNMSIERKSSGVSETARILNRFEITDSQLRALLNLNSVTFEGANLRTRFPVGESSFSRNGYATIVMNSGETVTAKRTQILCYSSDPVIEENRILLQFSDFQAELGSFVDSSGPDLNYLYRLNAEVLKEQDFQALVPGPDSFEWKGIFDFMS